MFAQLGPFWAFFCFGCYAFEVIMAAMDNDSPDVLKCLGRLLRWLAKSDWWQFALLAAALLCRLVYELFRAL